MRVGWIGLGIMGSRMALRVAKAGNEVHIAPEYADRVEHDGFRAALEPTDVARCEVIVLMLPGPAEVRNVFERLLFPSMGNGAILIDMTTSSPELASEMSVRLTPRGIAVLDAPVSGGPGGAENGSLSIFVGGPDDAVRRAMPILTLLGTTIVHHGPAGFGQRAKLVNQVAVGGTTALVAEMFAAAASLGLDQTKVMQSLQNGVSASPLLTYIWERLAASNMAPGFKVAHMMKDLDLLEELFDAETVRLPMTRAAQSLFRETARLEPGSGTQAVVKRMRTDEPTPGMPRCKL